MIKKALKFLDNHRIILILLILIIISIIFISFNIYAFFNYKFIKLECTKNINEELCYNNNTIILINPDNKKEKIFKEYKNNLKSLKETYKLPEFNLYTAYYYTLASNVDYKMNKRNKTLNDFLNNYSNTYNLEKFYKKNNLYYRIFLPYYLT